MKAITYTTPWANEGTRELEGYPTGVPGLVISSHPADELVEGFTIVHLRSGALIAGSFPSPEAALAAVQAFGRLDVDWTKSGDEMQAYANPAFLDLVSDIADRYDGMTGIGSRCDGFPDNGVTR